MLELFAIWYVHLYKAYIICVFTTFGHKTFWSFTTKQRKRLFWRHSLASFFKLSKNLPCHIYLCVRLWILEEIQAAALSSQPIRAQRFGPLRTVWAAWAEHVVKNRVNWFKHFNSASKIMLDFWRCLRWRVGY